MAAQVASYFRSDVAASGRAVARTHTFPGTALCDWLSDIKSETDPANPSGFHPDAAVLSFSGAAFTPCMKSASGVADSGASLVAKYSRDTAEAIAAFTAARIPVYVASSPLSRSQSASYTGLTPLGRMYSQLPSKYRNNPLVHYIDAATPLEWHGKLTFTLPCQKGEACTGTWPDGTKTVVVRQSDGTHFCPVAETVHADGSRTCPVFMPGGQRFAMALATPVLRDLTG
jgi:hypothetical protein